MQRGKNPIALLNMELWKNTESHSQQWMLTWHRKIIATTPQLPYVSINHTPSCSTVPIYRHNMGPIGCGVVGVHDAGNLIMAAISEWARCAVQVNTSEHEIASVYCVQRRLSVLHASAVRLISYRYDRCPVRCPVRQRFSVTACMYRIL